MGWNIPREGGPAASKGGVRLHRLQSWDDDERQDSAFHGCAPRVLLGPAGETPGCVDPTSFSQCKNDRMKWKDHPVKGEGFMDGVNLLAVLMALRSPPRVTVTSSKHLRLHLKSAAPLGMVCARYQAGIPGAGGACRGAGERQPEQGRREAVRSWTQPHNGTLISPQGGR